MIKSHQYPFIMKMLVCISFMTWIIQAIGFFINPNDANVVSFIVSTLQTSLLLMAYYLSTTLMNAVIDKLADSLDENQKARKLILPLSDIKQIGMVCNKLDKYGVAYDIDHDTNKIIAHVTMGLYTRMLVADNLDDCVRYHIVGTDTVLVKNPEAQSE